ncbi:MAG: DUF4937 domain-containing protein [Bacteroidetes bacterium]|nr:MAG: DUF4937 domain-containing protein [Bacteroidota bacterium]
MFIKWIICDVLAENKIAFSNAQEQWAFTASAEGFIAQAGGWNLNNKSEACIIAFWKSEDHLKQFMKKLHDEIFFGSQQGDTYESIQVAHFETQLTMEGSCYSLVEAVQNAGFLRVADCKVKSEKLTHFEKVQQEIWLPAMKSAKGMLGGKFSKSETDQQRYLVTTFWDTLDNHSIYSQNILPDCKRKSEVADDTEHVSGKLVELEHSWKVIGEKS